MRRLAFLLLCGFYSPTLALDVPPLVAEYEPIVVQHAAAAEVKVVPWGATEPGFLSETYVKRFTDHTVIGGPVGTYLIAGDGDLAWVVRSPSDGPVPPGPQPGPSPQPKPEPSPDPRPVPLLAKWLVIVEEMQDRGNHPAKTSVITDRMYWQSINDRGMQVRIYDKDQPESESYKKVINEPLPVMMLMEDSKNYRVFPVPDSTEAVDAIIRENVVR